MLSHQSFVNTAKTAALLAVLGGALVVVGGLIGSTGGAVIGLVIAVGLIDATWPARLPRELGERLQQILDTPDG